MKTIVKTALTILLGTMFSCSIMVAQGQAQSDQPMTGTQVMKPVLNKEQKAMLKNDLQKRKEIRQAFKATLTQEQKDLLTDPRVMPLDRKKSFRASLTDQQVNMIKEGHKEIKAMKNEFRSTLSPEQKMQLRKRAVNRGRMNRFIFERDL
jgi:hypothetical protein